MSSKLIFATLLLSNILLSTSSNTLTFQQVLAKIYKSDKMQKLAVAGGDSISMIQCCRQAKDLKIVDSILIGDAEKIHQAAKKANTDISDFEIVDIKDPVEIARYAIKLVHDKKADIYSKGNIETEIFIDPIYDPEIGLKTDRMVSGVTIVEVEELHRLMLLADPHVVQYPNITQKVNIIENTVQLAHSIGIVYPKVGVVAAFKEVHSKMKETVEADELEKMSQNGEMKGCVVDGPLPFELCIDPYSPEYKEIDKRKIRGDADILLFPNIHAASIAYHFMTHVLHYKSATMIIGTSAPCVVNSRAGSAESKLNSIILSIGYSHYLKKMHGGNY